MNYLQIIDYLFNQLANYQKVGASAYKPGLENIKSLLKAIDNPHIGLKTIHLAGTNGKGSTSHILASILIENGYKVGLFTSPHIKDFRERIKINGKLVAQKDVVDFVNKNIVVFNTLNPSFFEITTAMAFSIFKDQKCDIAIIEAGLGGRLDSTNVINPEVSIITNIGLDHTNFLGTTLIEIANEKAGIIKPNTPIIVGEKQLETTDVFKRVADINKSEIIFVEPNQNFRTDLLGTFQQKNIATAIKAIESLKIKGWYIDDVKTKLALTKVKRNTSLIGRLERIQSNPNVIIDASHNVDGIKNLFYELSKIKYDNMHCIFATSSDKAIDDIISLLPKSHKYYFTTFETKRSLPLDKLEKIAKSNKLNYSIFNTAKKALQVAKEGASENDLIVVFGSFFLLEKII